MHYETPPCCIGISYSASAAKVIRYDLIKPSRFQSITPLTSDVWNPVRWSFTRRSSKT